MDQSRICPCAAGRVLAFAPTYEPIIRLDPQDGRIEGRQLSEIAAMLTARLDWDAYPPGGCRCDAHIKTRPTLGPGSALCCWNSSLQRRRDRFRWIPFSPSR